MKAMARITGKRREDGGGFIILRRIGLVEKVTFEGSKRMNQKEILN